jgi:hypothetical protein
VRDVWAHADLGVFDSGYTVSVPSHGAALLLVRGTEAGSLAGAGPPPDADRVTAVRR